MKKQKEKPILVIHRRFGKSSGRIAELLYEIAKKKFPDKVDIQFNFIKQTMRELGY